MAILVKSLLSPVCNNSIVFPRGMSFHGIDIRWASVKKMITVQRKNEDGTASRGQHINKGVTIATGYLRVTTHLLSHPFITTKWFSIDSSISIFLIYQFSYRRHSIPTGWIMILHLLLPRRRSLLHEISILARASYSSISHLACISKS